MANEVEAPRLVALKTVRAWTSLSEMSIRRLMERDQFPKPVKLSSNRVAWREPEVAAWINSRVEAA
ncbi:helix-turn-helix transcriptional regulator [Phenylobacterium sp.]|uniref:helix-turn-helix transcriptional regulator n=1 Tax=Phenylobacterium sp. TaxID=1871053 RepID=UPI00345B5A02